MSLRWIYLFVLLHSLLVGFDMIMIRTMYIWHEVDLDEACITYCWLFG
jgi:hypothetical protein